MESQLSYSEQKSKRKYLCIDLKSFYASVECVERNLDPFKVNLVVADPDRSENTICLAITPAMKACGVKNRCRIKEIPPNVSYIVAMPRMQLYIDYSADIYAIYLKYVSKDDIHPYSIDEAFMDVTDYLSLYNMDARTLGQTIIADIYNSVGIRATCGIGSNLYLAKIALDITAKHSPDFIGELDEETYRQSLWNHQPLTDFWRIGHGTANRLYSYGILTMKDIANTSEDLLYRIFGKDAELLIDHAWGIEPTTIADIKAYKPSNNSLSSGQVLMRDYKFNEGEIIVKEMTDLLCLDMVSKDIVTHSVTLHVGYSHNIGIESAHGTAQLDIETNSNLVIVPAIARLYRQIVVPYALIRRINITANNIIPEEYHQYSLFTDVEALEKNRKMQKAVIDIKQKFGNNAILKAANLDKASTAIERNEQIGGHRSGIQTKI